MRIVFINSICTRYQSNGLNVKTLQHEYFFPIFVTAYTKNTVFYVAQFYYKWHSCHQLTFLQAKTTL